MNKLLFSLCMIVAGAAIIPACAAPKVAGRTDFGVPWRLEWLDQKARAQLARGTRNTHSHTGKRPATFGA